MELLDQVYQLLLSPNKCVKLREKSLFVSFKFQLIINSEELLLLFIIEPFIFKLLLLCFIVVVTSL